MNHYGKQISHGVILESKDEDSTRNSVSPPYQTVRDKQLLETGTIITKIMYTNQNGK